MPCPQGDAGGSRSFLAPGGTKTRLWRGGGGPEHLTSPAIALHSTSFTNLVFSPRRGQELASKKVVTQNPCSSQKQTKGLGILPEQHLLVWKTIFGNLVSCKASLDHPGTLQRKTAVRFQHSSPGEGGALLWRGLPPTVAWEGSLRSCQEGKAIYTYTSGSKLGATLHLVTII